jgi:FAD/FMN-containing dehydrogenase
MTGGPLSKGIIVDFTRYFKEHSIDEETLEAIVSPGLYYRNFEKELLPDHLTMPSYPASKSIAALGGIIMNNSGGERSLRWGQTRDYVKDVRVVLSDGSTATFGKISRDEVEKKKQYKNFEGEIYRKVDDVLQSNKDLIKNAEPATSKNSAGYALWHAMQDDGGLDLGQIIVGSQGTLSLLSKATLRLIHDKPHQKLVAVFFKSWDDIPAVVNKVLPYEPESLEVFDDATLKLGLRFMPQIAKKTGEGLFRFAMRFIPEAVLGIKMMGMPKLIMLVELAEDTMEEVDQKSAQVVEALTGERVWTRTVADEHDADKYWIMRRESFALLRKHVGDKKTAPFIEDFGVLPKELPVFLPKALAVLKKYGITANIAGHAGNGNFHIIPLMDLSDEKERAKIRPCADEFYDLVVEHGGTITAEHNDGIMRTPYLEKMYGQEVMKLFKEVKNIFDPLNIFNPGKKIDISKEYLEEHIAKE